MSFCSLDKCLNSFVIICLFFLCLSLTSCVNGTAPKINSEIIDKLADYFEKKSGVLLVFLFGSAAGGKMTEESDIDIGILFESAPDIFIFEINELKIY